MTRFLVTLTTLSAALAAVACASGEGKQTSSDGNNHAIDARPGVPDAPPGTPDAPPGTPDAPPGTPDAHPGSPDAMTVVPDAPPGGPVAQLLLNEVNPNITGSHDLIELLVVTAGSTNGITVVQDIAAPTVLVTLPAINVAAGDVIVVHMTPTAANGDGSASETTAKNQFPQSANTANSDNAWDVRGNAVGITFSQRVLEVKAPGGAVQDAVPFVRTAGTPPASFPTELQAIQGAGLWLPANCGGSPCTTTTTPTAAGVAADWTTCGATPAANSIHRAAGANTKTAADWSISTSSFGQP